MTAPSGFGSSAASSSIVDRMRRAATLDTALYEEVEHDPSATGQAAVVVALAAAAVAIGNAFRGGPGLFGALVGYLVGWALWSGITYLVGTRLFGGRATWGEILRTFGFAQAPGVLYLAAIVPVLGRLVNGVVGLWLLVTGFVALRQALDVSTARVVLTVLLGWAAWVAATLVLRGALGVPVY